MLRKSARWTIGIGLILSSGVVNGSILRPTSSAVAVTPINGRNIFSKSGLGAVRGGGTDTTGVKEKRCNANPSIQSPKLEVEAILIPRQTSFLTPLRFVSFLLINISFNYCMQTAGKPMEDAVRRILNMPSSAEGSPSLVSKVTPLHVYVAKKLLSSTSSSTSVEILPPAHLPSPLPLLGLLSSIMLYIGGTILAPEWSVHADAFLNYERFDLNDESTTKDASNTLWNWFEQEKYYKVDPYYQSALKRPSAPAVLINDGSICPLFFSQESSNQDDNTGHSFQNYLDHPRRYYFEFGGKRYYYDPEQTESTSLVCGGPDLNELPIYKLNSGEYTCGLNTELKLSKARERYGKYLHISIPVPTLRTAFVSRMTSPLVSLQLVGRLLSILEDETIGKSLSNLCRLAIQHVSDAKRSIETASTLANEVKENEELGGELSHVKIWAVRPSDAGAAWVEVMSSELLPGDVFVIASESESSYFEPPVTIPVDCLLLEGTCVTEEAALTGESIPQPKIPLEISIEDIDQHSQLDMNGHHRSSCLFAGTKLLHGTNDNSISDEDFTSVFKSLPRLPRALRSKDRMPTLYLTLSSGYYSSRGEIIQSLVKSKSDLGAVSSRESQIDQMRLIGMLSLFAAGACIYLLVDSKRDSLFRQIVQCTRIAVAAVPSDLPVSLSASARECAAVLREESDAICSDPAALIKSSSIDCIVFDKTGTLTADTQSLVHVTYPPQNSSDSVLMSQIVLAGSHTLVSINGTLIGDPLDRACLDFSGFEYNAQDKSAKDADDTNIWTVKSFPFDSNEKMSSALVLVRQDSRYRLLVAVKGSNTKLQSLFNDVDVIQWQQSEVSRLGRKGYRTISLAVLDASETKLTSTLFPSGLPQYHDATKTIHHLIQQARNRAKSIHRHDIERQSSFQIEKTHFSLVGIASFDARIRASTSRVIRELKEANVQLRMLTGDDVSTSLAAAAKSGMISREESKNVYVMKLSNTGSLALEFNNRKIELTLSTAKRIHRKLQQQKAVIAVIGNVVHHILSDKTLRFTGITAQDDRETLDYVRDKLLPNTLLVTSASPDDKNIYIYWLQHILRKHVLMCGDGVNDINAMTEADVSVAMMSGFGQEAFVDCDMARMDRLKRRRIGSNRIAAMSAYHLSTEEQVGIGQTPLAASVRIQQRISAQLLKKDASSSTAPFNIVLSSVAEEIRRFRKLRKGGKDAACILAEEDRLRQSLQQKAELEKGSVHVESVDNHDSTIKTGEACLASTFTLLRPSIAGVETIMRAGTAAACSSITLYKKIALNCMLSCYNLATIYKNGLRYGKWMWQCELFGIIYIDNASFKASATPRPWLVADTRPPSSPFSPAEILSTLLQAIIHITTLTLSVRQGKKLDTCNQGTHNGLRIKWKASCDRKGSVGAVLASLVNNPENTFLYQQSPSSEGFFRRSPFQPNHVSNSVFISSVFQNAVMALVNHPGKPFSVAFLESRPLCLSVGLSFLLCIVCITETFPLLNKFLQLAPFPTKSSRIALIRLLVLNVALNYFAEYISTFLFRYDVWMKRYKLNKVQLSEVVSCAAEKEAQLLEEERSQNILLVSVMFVFGCSLLLPQIMLFITSPISK